MFTLPIGYARRKIDPIEVVGVESNYVASGFGVNVPVPNGRQSGDLIVACGGGSQDTAILGASGYTALFLSNFSGITTNHFGVVYKTSDGTETSVDLGFQGSVNAKFGIAMVLRNAVTNPIQYTNANQPNSSSPLVIGSHTESDSTSLALLFAWVNQSGSTNSDVTAEPSGGYTLAARVDGNVGSDPDRILSCWYRRYANRGIQQPTYSVSPAGSNDAAFADIRVQRS